MKTELIELFKGASIEPQSDAPQWYADRVMEIVEKTLFSLTDNDVLLSKNLKYLRESKGYSLAQICLILGINSRATYHCYESGISKPDIIRLRKLSILYNTTIEELSFTDLTPTT